jgi:sec-independent protein translocase protein TatA
MFGSIGMQELIIIFVIALIIFGPRRLPDLGKSLGRSIAEFKRASNDLRNTLEEEIRVDEQRQTKAATAADAPATPESQTTPTTAAPDAEASVTPDRQTTPTTATQDADAPATGDTPIQNG